MSTNTTNLELINAALSTPFTNAADNDVALYPASSNQSIHIGCKTGATNASMLKVTNSNVEIEGKIASSTYGFNAIQIFTNLGPWIGVTSSAFSVKAGTKTLMITVSGWISQTLPSLPAGTYTMRVTITSAGTAYSDACDGLSAVH